MLAFYLMKNERDAYDEDCRMWLESKHSCDLDFVLSKYEAFKYFFRIDMSIKIFLVDEGNKWQLMQKDLDLPDWVCAFSFEDKVVMKTPDLWMSNNVGTFEETLVHEMVHCFIAGACQKPLPIWLIEGLAIYLSGQDQYYEKRSTKGLCMEDLTYEDTALYDLSISRLMEMLKTQDIGGIIRDCISGGVEGEIKHSKSGGSRY